MLNWLKEKLKTWLLEEEEIRYAAMERIDIGKLPEEKLAFWIRMQNFLGSPEGKTFMAIQQKEYERLHGLLLAGQDKASEPELVARMKQQNFVISTPFEVEKRVTKWRQEVARKTKKPAAYPQHQGEAHAR